MGGRKARLLVGGVPLAALHRRRLFEAGATSVAVVLRPEDFDLDVGAALRVASTEPDQAGSLARGLDGLEPAQGDAMVVVPVDTLPAKLQTIRTLVLALDRGVDAVVPTFGGRGGHPVVVRASVALAARGRPLREVLAALGERRTYVPVDDPAVTTDLDTPEAVLRALAAPPRFA